MSIKLANSNKVLFKREPQLYDCTSVQELINKYLSRQGIIYTIDEGVLGHGTLVLSAPNCKYCIVQEVYLNEWSSGHKIKFYNNLPKKWEQAIDSISN